MLLRLVGALEGIWVEGYTRDEVDTKSPVDGYEFRGYLVRQAANGHYVAIRYAGGSFWLLDSPCPRPQLLTQAALGEALGGGSRCNNRGVRHFRVFQTLGQRAVAPQAAAPASPPEAPEPRKTCPEAQGRRAATPGKAEKARGIESPKVYESLDAFRAEVAAALMGDRLSVFWEVTNATVRGKPPTPPCAPAQRLIFR